MLAFKTKDPTAKWQGRIEAAEQALTAAEEREAKAVFEVADARIALHEDNSEASAKRLDRARVYLRRLEGETREAREDLDACRRGLAKAEADAVTQRHVKAMTVLREAAQERERIAADIDALVGTLGEKFLNLCELGARMHQAAPFKATAVPLTPHDALHHLKRVMSRSTGQTGPLLPLSGQSWDSLQSAPTFAERLAAADAVFMQAGEPDYGKEAA